MTDSGGGQERLNGAQAKVFYELVWPHRSAVLRVARILCGNDAESEDLAQESLLKAFRGIERLKPGSDVKAWLMTILRNTRIDRLRAGKAEGRNVSLADLEMDPADPRGEETEWRTPEDVLNAFSDQQVIEALQRLPEEIRWTMLLVDVEGWEHKDAAALLEVPVGTIKSRVHRGRGMLRSALLPLAREMRLIGEHERTDHDDS